jgi:hypothetical protein
MKTLISVTGGLRTHARRIKRLPRSTAPLLRLNGLCPYYTMFPLAFPFNALANANAEEWVLDPFCGRGTTIFAARLHGLPSVGIDSNPVAAAIAASKLVWARSSEVVALAAQILNHTQPGPIPNYPRGDFWELCYASETLRDICRLRNHLLRSCTTRVEVALRGVLLGILHGPINKGKPTYLSNQMPRSYSTKPRPAVDFWKRRGLKPIRVDVLDAVRRRASFSFAEMPPPSLGRVLNADSRQFDPTRLSTRYSWVITSPPYYGMRTYFPDHWLRNWFVGGPDEVDYRADEQVSHQSEDRFVADLALVWKRVAKVCVPGAKFVCRFGAIPSRTKDPQALFMRTLEEADCGWRVTTIRKAGTSKKGRRQCDQFGTGNNKPVEEIDVYAVLDP